MTSSIFRRLVMTAALLALPVVGFAQEAALSGTVTDSTGAVLPGVTVTAVHEASGNIFETVTDGRGAYRLPVRVGTYRLTAVLQGFTTVTRTGVQLLVGQQAVVNVQMAPSSVQETVTVTAEAPLIDTTSSTLGGNVDPRQLSELPVNGRNWIDLTMLAPGMRQNHVSEQPVAGTNNYYQLNVDGQQVTNDIGANSFGSPRYSRDSIAEFQFLSSRFDATQGRSAGVQVNAITKSGTNTFAGSVSGYFRSDRFNAADFIQDRVLPYSNQQVSTTFGGPIRTDRIHFFGNYEFEREPQTAAYTTPYSTFNIDQSGTRREQKGGVRLDFQLASQTRLMVRANKYYQHIPLERAGGATSHPSMAQLADRYTDQLLATMTQVLSNRALNELSVGYAGYSWRNVPIVTWQGHPQPEATRSTGGYLKGAPRIQLIGFNLGHDQQTAPQWVGLNNYSLRDNLTVSFSKGGRHDVKLGGEYIYIFHWINSCRNCIGTLDARGGPIPANLEELIPVWNDPTTWNLDAFSRLARRYTIGVGDFPVYAPRHVYAAWLQDDWALTRRLTLNAGLRYDLSIGMFANWLAIPPFLEADRPDDTNNFGPRLGLTYSLNDQTVLRGGLGKYFGDTPSQSAHWTVAWSQIANVEVLNDGRPDFASNPFGGRPLPTYDEVIRSGRRDVSNFAAPDLVVPSSWQGAIGLQRQLGSTMAVEADYVFVGHRHELATRNINLAFNRATGANYPFTNVATRPYSDWGSVGMYRADGRTNSHSLQTAFTKRMSSRWQASATYTLAGDWVLDRLPLNPGCEHPIQPSGACDTPFTLAPDLGTGTMRWDGKQRHRVVFNGIWEAGYGFQLSGLYFFGSGERLTSNSGADVRITGGGAGRLRRDGTLIPWNDFATTQLHRVDMRVQRRVRLGHINIDGILEVFNAFNHENYGSWVTNESNRSYGQPSFNDNVAYQPRILQLGFRATF